ncbi:urease accessory protein [Arthrobacter sp. CAN_A212]|uniref:urease accessory UreF family protein n=1 Tax=Arthrobacter sp. CAN_A212 TaxID=2787719 RepID=UPI0018CADB2B
MGVSASALAGFLLADSRLPSGAYAHSAGLEPAVLGGLGPGQVYGYLLSRLTTVMRVEAAAAVLAHRRAVLALAQAQDESTDTGGSPPGTLAFAPIEAALDARTPAEAQREASRQLGRGMLRLAVTLVPGNPAVARLAREVPKPTRPVALGVLGAALGVPELELALLCCYDDAQSVVAAALKLLPIDPMTGTRWILDAGTAMDDVARAALTIHTEDDLPALSAPWMEQWAQEHTTRTRRLFVA